MKTSYATLYQIAPSRDEIITVAFHRWYDATMQLAIAKLNAVTDPGEQLACWTESAVNGVAKMSPAFLRDVSSHSGIHGVLASYVHYWVEVLHVILDAGIARGQFRPINARVLAAVWEAGSMKLAETDLIDATQQSPAEIARDWVDIMFHGVIAPPSR